MPALEAPSARAARRRTRGRDGLRLLQTLQHFLVGPQQLRPRLALLFGATFARRGRFDSHAVRRLVRARAILLCQVFGHARTLGLGRRLDGRNLGDFDFGFANFDWRDFYWRGGFDFGCARFNGRFGRSLRGLFQSLTRLRRAYRRTRFRSGFGRTAGRGVRRRSFGRRLRGRLGTRGGARRRAWRRKRNGFNHGTNSTSANQIGFIDSSDGSSIARVSPFDDRANAIFSMNSDNFESPLVSTPPASAALAIFCRAPQLGEVKTRLAATRGAAFALELYRAMLRDTFDLARALAPTVEGFACFTPAAAFEGELNQLWSGAHLPQNAGDLGARMLGCLGELRARGCGRVAVIGSDAPDLPLAILERAFELLSVQAVVIGPSADGGFYYLGASRALPDEIFAGIIWSRDDVCARLRGNLERLGIGCELLPTWSDVDDERDLAALVARGDGAVWTRAVLAERLRNPCAP